MIVCSGPNCQTTAGCQCRRRSDTTAHWPPILGPSRSEVDRAFAAGRLAGIREAAAWHVLKAAHYERQVHDTFGKGEFHTDAARAILALAEGKEG